MSHNYTQNRGCNHQLDDRVGKRVAHDGAVGVAVPRWRRAAGIRLGFVFFILIPEHLMVSQLT